MKQKQSSQKSQISEINLPFRIIKMMDIGYIYTLYFISGFITGILIDKLFFRKLDENKLRQTPLSVIIIETISLLWLNGCCCYIARNIVEMIPSPINDVWGLIHDRRIVEIRQPSVFLFTAFFFENCVRIRMKYLYTYFTHNKIV
jgi:hypothetical protein